MHLREKVARLFIPGGKVDSFDSSQKLLDHESKEVQALGHYNLARIYKAESKRIRFLSPIYQSFSRFHLDEALLKSEKLPGPNGMEGSSRIADGDFREGIKHIEVEAIRLHSWIETFEGDVEEERIKLFLNRKLGGHTLCELGKYSESRVWLKQAIADFDGLSPDVRALHAPMAEEVILTICWTLQCEQKYETALVVAEEALHSFSFAAYPTKARELLQAAHEVLIQLTSTTKEYIALSSPEEFVAELIDRVQQAETSKALNVVKGDILFQLKSEAFRLGIETTAEAARRAFAKQQELIQTMPMQSTAPVKYPNPLSEEEIKQRYPENPQAQQAARTWNQVIEASETQGTIFRKELEEFDAMTKQVSAYLNAEMLKTIDALTKRSIGSPLQLWLRWHLMTLMRFGVQILAVSILIEEVLRRLFDLHEVSIKALVRLEGHDWIYKGLVILLLFGMGFRIEEQINEWTIRRRKRFLMQLLIDQLRALWGSYNGILNLEKLGRGQLADIQERLAERERTHAELVEIRRKQAERDAEFMFMDFPDRFEEGTSSELGKA